MSYAGNGVFIVLSSNAALLSSEEIEADIQYLLDERNTEYDDGHPLDIEVSIGNPIRPDHSDVLDGARSIDRAIARAESRSLTKREAKPIVNIFRG